MQDCILRRLCSDSEGYHDQSRIETIVRVSLMMSHTGSTYPVNISGTNTEPCRTPHFKIVDSDLESLILTNCLWLHR